jgi:hypothetical protein
MSTAHVVAFAVAGTGTGLGIGISGSAFWIDKKLRGRHEAHQAEAVTKKEQVQALLANEGDPRKRMQLHRSLVSSVAAIPRAADFRASDLPVETWAVSVERDRFIERRTRSYISAIGGVVLGLSGAFLCAAFGMASHDSATSMVRSWAIAAIAVGLWIICYSTVPYMAARSAYKSRRLATATAQVDRAITEATNGAPVNPDDPDGPRVAPLELPALFALNRRQLDAYQEITKKQQGSANRLAQIASVVAFVVLIAGIVLAATLPGGLEKSFAGGLSAFGAALSSFLAATFFKASKAANKQMNSYYLEPQRTGRLLAAERIVTAVKPLVLAAPEPEQTAQVSAPDGKPAPAAEAADEPANGAATLSEGGAILIAKIVEAVLSWEMPAPRKSVEQRAVKPKAPAGEQPAVAVGANGSPVKP